MPGRYDNWEGTAWEMLRSDGSRATIQYGACGYRWNVTVKGPNGVYTGEGSAIELERAKVAAERAIDNLRSTAFPALKPRPVGA